MNNTDKDAAKLVFVIKFCLRLFVYLAAAWLSVALLGEAFGLGLAVLFIVWLAYFTSSVFFRLSQIEQRLADKEQDAAERQ